MDLPPMKIHGVNTPGTGGELGAMTAQVNGFIQQKLAAINALPGQMADAIRQRVAQLQAQQVNLGTPTPAPASGSTTPGVSSALTAPIQQPPAALNLGVATTPGVNTALTAEQQRALMFQVA